jgi:hypothetical protein
MQGLCPGHRTNAGLGAAEECRTSRPLQASTAAPHSRTMDIEPTLPLSADDLLPPQRPRAADRMPPLAATELQDHLLVATNDLDRLQRLLNDAGDALVGHFHAAAGQLKLLLRAAAQRPDLDAAALNQAMDHLAGAITSLQFQDMASQLLEHTGRRLRNCADRLAADAMELEGEEDEAFLDTVPMGPNPVMQDELKAGSVELF